jgi:NAD(P)-dependent dehydrogenase (short-subunit alcohol dehydrogenase family)
VLEGKRILVIGPNSEISENLVHVLLLENSKEVLFVCPNEISSKLDDNLILTNLDIHNFDSIDLFIKSLDQKKFDGVVFAAGIGGVRPLKLNSASFVESMFQKNIFTFFEWVRVLLKSKLIEDGASIVAISSVSSVKGLKAKSVYSASKAALDAAIRGMASELAERKIRVNSIQKGWVTSDMNLDFIQTNMALSKDDDLSQQLLGPINPLEIANLTCFLLSDKVRTITGQNIRLDGGYTL